MLITLRLYTSNKCLDDNESLQTIGQPVAFTKPMEFHYNGEPLEYDPWQLTVTRKHWGMEVVFPTNAITIPEGSIGYLVPNEHKGSGTVEDPVVVYDIVVSVPSLEMRFREYKETDQIPKPQYSDLGSLALEIGELAKLTGSKWDIGFNGVDYLVTIDGELQFSPNVEFLHRAVLKKFAEMTLNK